MKTNIKFTAYNNTEYDGVPQVTITNNGEDYEYFTL